jgi:hypothetical protein
LWKSTAMQKKVLVLAGIAAASAFTAPAPVR